MLFNIRINPFLLSQCTLILAILSSLRNISSAYYLGVIVIMLTIFILNLRKAFVQGFIASVFYIFLFLSFCIIFWSGIYMQSWDFIPGIPRLLIMPLITFLFFPLLNNNSRFSKLLIVILVCYIIGALSVIYQIIFGSISWFAPQFLRANLDRYASILGSLTIYGAIVGYGLVLVYSNAILKRGLIIKLLFFFTLIIAGFFSLSKAGIVMIMLATLVYVIFNFGSITERLNFKNVIGTLFLLFIGVLLMFQISEIREYYNVIVTQTIGGSSFLSNGLEVQMDSQAVSFEHIHKRLFYWTSGMLETYGNMVYFFGVGLQGGAGTMGVVPEIGDYGSSHNSLGDLFFMGGTIFLGVFLVLYFFTQFVLFMNRKEPLSILFFTLNVLFFANILVASGSIFQPAISCIFWISIIYANNISTSKT